MGGLRLALTYSQYSGSPALYSDHNRKFEFELQLELLENSRHGVVRVTGNLFWLL